MGTTPHGIGHAELLATFDFDPETGAFTRKRREEKTHSDRAYNSRFLRGANRTGHVTKASGLVIGFQYHRYKADDLAWFYVHDEWPPHGVRHLNGDLMDNRIANLELRGQNDRKVERRGWAKSTSPYKGVSYVPTKGGGLRPWVAQIYHEGKVRQLGCFADEATAARTYDRAARELKGPYAFLNFPDEPVKSLCQCGACEERRRCP